MVATILDRMITRVENLFKGKNKKAGWVWVGFGEDPFKDSKDF